jgi:hypothetical protein
MLMREVAEGAISGSRLLAEVKLKELYARFPSTWAHGDLFIGKITSDGAALITFRFAPNEIPAASLCDRGERLVEYLLRQEVEARAKAA